MNPKGAKSVHAKKWVTVGKQTFSCFFPPDKKERYHFDYIIATTISVTWYTFNKMWHPKVITYSHCRGCCGGADRLGKAFFLPFGFEPLVGKQTLRGSSWSIGGWLNNGKLSGHGQSGLDKEGGTGGNDGGFLDLSPEWWLPVCPACPSRLLPLSGHFKGICLASHFQSHICPNSLCLWLHMFLLYILSFIVNTFLVCH